MVLLAPAKESGSPVGTTDFGLMNGAIFGVVLDKTPIRPLTTGRECGITTAGRAADGFA